MENSLLLFILGSIFVIGYAFIALEHNFKINKSGTAIVIGSLLWLIVDFFSHFETEVGEALMHETQEIFSIVVFLLAAMTIVEILVHYRFFDWIQDKIMQKKISAPALFWLLGGLTFILSAFLDNLTTTLIMIQIGRKIYKNKDNFLLFTANTIIAANAGGAFSPIGDVTTIMLWLAQKFSAWQIISLGFLPSLAAWIIPQFLIGRKIKHHEEAEKAHKIEVEGEREAIKPYWSIVAIGFMSFLLPVVFNLIGLPPFLGLLTGVGILWMFIDITSKKHDDHYREGQVINMIQKVDISTLKFFIGILLAVGALSHIGLLAHLSNSIFGAEFNVTRLIGGNIILGFMSSILDNVPLVAAAIKMLAATTPTAIWVLLALTAGTGGSLLVIGSAAGVAAMGQVKELTFGYYLKKVTFPALLGYLAAILVWMGLYFWVL
ncbi:MAG: sodium:proton antiporter NhaD [Candidatus Falkowbacteria bacterium]|nr:MAG: sodium:proton antiporter NhaD [Candidatus Falkowbacteria bacterium]